MERVKSVDEYLERNEEWSEELTYLRSVMLDMEMEETMKWSFPVYTIDGKNVVGLGAFKSYVGIWFFQGGLLRDEQQLLMNAQEGKTKAMRQWRFQSKAEMDDSLIRAYVLEAIENQKAGKQIKAKRGGKRVLVLPDELKQALSVNNSLAEHFEQFTPGRQREFAEYVGEAKREDTRRRRLEKIIPMIMDGVGLNDQYR